MKDPTPDWHWLDPSVVISAQELSRCCRLRPEDLHELVAYGALEQVDPASGVDMFSSEWVAPLRAAAKLRADFDLDLFAMGVVLGYLRRIDALEKEVQHLRAHLPAHSTPAHHEPGRWREGHGTAHPASR